MKAAFLPDRGVVKVSGEDGRSVGAFPLIAGSRDAVIVRALSPGAYTLHIFGAPATSGVVLVEVYEGK